MIRSQGSSGTTTVELSSGFLWWQAVPYRPFLARIRELFQSEPDRHLESIEDGFKSGSLRPPAHPMSDQELARAIREFCGAPVSDTTIRELASRFEQE